MMMNALIAAIHQGSPFAPDESRRFGRLTASRPRRAGGGRRRARRARARRPATSLRLTRARSSTEVPFERTDDRVAGLDRAPRRVGGGELELGRRPLERELADALDERAREERPVADEPELAEEVLAGRLRARAARRASGAGAGASYGVRSGSPAVPFSSEPSTPPKISAESSSKTTTACGETVDRRSARRASRSRRARPGRARSRRGAGAAAGPRG